MLLASGVRHQVVNRMLRDYFGAINMDKKEMKKLIMDLKNPDSKVRLNAAQKLEDAAEKKEDISAALPTLFQSLYDKHVGVQQSSIWAIKVAQDKGASMIPYISDLNKALSINLVYVPEVAAEILGDAVKETDISSSVSALVKCTSTSEDYLQFVRADSARALIKFANKNKENAKLVLNEIEKSKIDRNITKVKELISKCNEILKE